MKKNERKQLNPGKRETTVLTDPEATRCVGPMAHPASGATVAAATQAPVFLTVSATLRVPAQRWQGETQSAEIEGIVERLARGGQLLDFKVQVVEPARGRREDGPCGICGWVHDTGLFRIELPGGRTLALPRRLAGIVSLVHQAHRSGGAGLSTKDDKLLAVCGGYGNPCKAFDDLNRRDDYKLLFDTRQRGLLSLSGYRKKSEEIGSSFGMTSPAGRV